MCIRDSFPSVSISHLNESLSANPDCFCFFVIRYNTGILETKAERENEVKELVDTAAQSVFKSVDDHGIEAVDDWEVDELLEWTNTLNFDRLFNFIRHSLFSTKRV